MSCYTPLDRSLSCIRLLSVLPVLHPSKHRLQCRLTTVVLDTPGKAVGEAEGHSHDKTKSVTDATGCPPYKALSYTWGEPDDLGLMIWINNVLVPVRRNLFHVLQLFFAHGFHDDFYWIDALCINQKDDEERSAQVALMAYIYQQADEVLAWLGTPKEHEWKGWNVLTLPPVPGRPFRKTKPLPAFDLLESVPRDASPAPEVSRWYQQQFASSSSNNKMLTGRWKQLADMCTSPYWDRIWIVQEVILAQKLTLLYGRGICDGVRLDSLFGVVQEYEKITSWDVWRSTGRADGQVQSHISTLLQSNAIRLSNRRTSTLARQPSSGSGSTGKKLHGDKEMFLRGLLESFGLSLCSDPKDKVYGMLGIAQDVGRDDINISYSKTNTLFHLFESVIQFQRRTNDPSGQSLVSFSHTLQQSLLTPPTKDGHPLAMDAESFPGTRAGGSHVHSSAADLVVEVQAFCIDKISSTFWYEATPYLIRAAHKAKLQAELGRWSTWSGLTWEEHQSRLRAADPMLVFAPPCPKEVPELAKLFDDLAAVIDMGGFQDPFPTMWHGCYQSCSCEQYEAPVPADETQTPLLFLAPQNGRLLITSRPVQEFDVVCRFDDPSIVAIVRQRQCCETYEVVGRAIVPPELDKLGDRAEPWPTLCEMPTEANRKLRQQQKVTEDAKRHLGKEFEEIRLEMSTAILQALTRPISWKRV